MEIPGWFLESEVREGFYITAEMKRFWASTLRILEEIREICGRHNITWWMDWGALLATVRHGGFIPWDDDIDISMLRADYHRFLDAAAKELSPGYQICNIQTMPEWDDYISRIDTTFETNENEALFARQYGSPYMTGVDVHPMDYYSPKLDQAFTDIVKPVTVLASLLDPYGKYEDAVQYHDFINAIEKAAGLRFNREKPLAQQLRKYCEQIMSCVKKKDATGAVLMGAHLVNDGIQAILPVSWYEEFIEMPYEFMTVPVPLHYDAMLRGKFGNYMTPIRNSGMHDYPLYDKQVEYVREHFASVTLPAYRYG
ncbi:MAG: LicD family protein [Lachnospiraceae bacterium]|nr:LicD family protein [Lachnospiraceae bacterium]